MSLLFILPLSVLLILIFLFKKSKSSKAREPPHPPRLPVIGNLHQLNTACLHQSLWKLSRKHGPLMSLKLGSVPAIVVSSARLAEQVLKIKDTAFCSRPQMRGLRKFSYDFSDIAAAPYGQEWREMKKISVIHLLSAKRIQQFRPIRENELSKMMEKIRKDAQLSKATNLSDTFSLLTSTTIYRIAFGKSFDDGDDESQEKKRFDHLLHEVEAMVVGFFFSDYFPSIGWLDHLTGMNSRLESIFQKFDRFYQGLIDEHLDPNRPESMDNDIIDIMLQLQRDRSTSFHVTMDHVKAMLMNMFGAGTETSATTLTWAMTALMKNPNAMKKLQAEIREVVREKQLVEEEDVEKLPYLKATVKEAMRLYLVVPLLLPHETMEKCDLDGYEIQPKTLVYVNAWGIGRDPEVWDHPNEFFPERFLNSSIDLKGNDFQLIPFGSGRRSCPGYAMGLLTVQVVLANFIHFFDWELPLGMKVEDIDTKCMPGITVNKKTPLKLVARIPSTVT